MALINVDASRPSPLWAVLRLLVTTGRSMPAEQAKALLSPPCLGQDDSKMFERAIETLRMLGMLTGTDKGLLSLGPPAKSIDVGDYNSFAAAMRDRVLAPELNSDIGENSSQTGPRDLTRALAWFLSLDPANSAMNWSQVQQRQLRALKPQVGPAIVNPARWTCFIDWSTALGLSTPGLLDSDRLTPDCTTAVRQVMRASWKPGETVPAVEALHVLRDALPVLPGGRYATAVGLASPGDSVAGPALSFALLRGEDEEWLRLQRKADARQSLSIHDPESRSARPCSSIVLGENGDA